MQKKFLMKIHDPHECILFLLQTLVCYRRRQRAVGATEGQAARGGCGARFVARQRRREGRLEAEKAARGRLEAEKVARGVAEKSGSFCGEDN